MAKEIQARKETVARVMHGFKHGELDQRNGEPVRNPKQAIAIALREAGASNQEDPTTNQENLRRSKRKERQGETAKARAEGRGESRKGSPTRMSLYAEARRPSVKGRSTMTKAELASALSR